MPIHFHHYFDTLCSLKYFRDKNDPILRKLLLTQSDCIFSNYLPLINKALIIQEDTEVGNFADPLLMNVRDAINTIKSIDTPLIVLSQRQKENISRQHEGKKRQVDS